VERRRFSCDWLPSPPSSSVGGVAVLDEGVWKSDIVALGLDNEAGAGVLNVGDVD